MELLSWNIKFLFNYCPSILAKKVEWPIFSLLPFNSLNKGARINWTYRLEFVSSKNKGPVILCMVSAYHTQILNLRSYKGTSWIALELSKHEYLLFWLCILVLMETMLHPGKTQVFILYSCPAWNLSLKIFPLCVYCSLHSTVDIGCFCRTSGDIF